MKPHSRPNYHFWFLTAFGSTLLVVSIVLSWEYGHAWLRTLWHICQAQLHSLGLAWPLLIPALLTLSIFRGGLSILRQVRGTHRLVRTFNPLCEEPPARLQALLKNHRLKPDDVIFLNLSTPHAFCVGFWQPHIWLTSGMVTLLSDEELSAVVAHETYHLRLRDPLRLVISRALRSAFFFLPLAKDLAKTVELQQEIAADQAAITYLGDDLPLLCALQKLLQQPAAGTITTNVAAFSPFNVTEARLRRLIYPPATLQSRAHLARWVTSLGIIILLLGSTAFLPAQPTTGPDDAISCSPRSTKASQSPSTWLDYNL